jgi:hypothetical protein
MLIVTGCVVAGAGDLAFSLTGYTTALVCAVLQVRHVLGTIRFTHHAIF